MYHLQTNVEDKQVRGKIKHECALDFMHFLESVEGMDKPEGFDEAVKEGYDNYVKYIVKTIGWETALRTDPTAMGKRKRHEKELGFE